MTAAAGRMRKSAAAGRCRWMRLHRVGQPDAELASVAEQALEARELAEAIDRFLRTLPERECSIFLRRYWYVDSVQDIAARYALRENTAKSILFRTREKLRRYLAGNGFEIIKEDLAEEGKIYQITVCRYTGKPYKLTDTDAVIGYAPARRSDALFRRFAAARAEVYRAVAEGKRRASADTSAEDEIIAGIEAAIHEKEIT